MKVLKQVAGIDVAQKELVVTLGCLYEDFTVEFLSYKVFKNTDDGIKSLIEWAENKVFKTSDIHYVMEATGVYHQKFAYYLAGHNRNVYIVLPNKISNYIRTLDLKTITDKSCSQAIARFGLERKLNPWKKPDQAYHRLQQLTRERDQIVQQRSMVKNQLHAEKARPLPILKVWKGCDRGSVFSMGRKKKLKKILMKSLSLI
ncbi:transposase [uncultured Chryseobacterium sp.]|uniref:IS110 family transposase n=1 Tax=uncultured Chryseobacterium sp. TaxID=259322 RepID=UPI0025D5F09B|nr:transposase [uncultured Chryseobacterium sp.]